MEVSLIFLIILFLAAFPSFYTLGLFGREYLMAQSWMHQSVWIEWWDTQIWPILKEITLSDVLLVAIFLVISAAIYRSCYDEPIKHQTITVSSRSVTRSMTKPRQKDDSSNESSDQSSVIIHPDFTEINLAGQCNLIFGPMFSGKTTFLLHELTTLADVGLTVLYINHQDDVRVSTKSTKNVTTHHSQFKETSELITSVTVSSLADVDISEFDVIGIDEAQFFDIVREEESELEHYVRKWMVDENKIIYVASLSSDFRMKRFGYAPDLVCLASSISMLHAKCMECLRQTKPYPRLVMVEAPYSCKISGSASQKEAGDKDMYLAVCIKCHKKHSEKFLEPSLEEEDDPEEEDEETRDSDSTYHPEDEDEGEGEGEDEGEGEGEEEEDEE